MSSQQAPGSATLCIMSSVSVLCPVNTYRTDSYVLTVLLNYAQYRQDGWFCPPVLLNTNRTCLSALDLSGCLAQYREDMHFCTRFCPLQLSYHTGTLYSVFCLRLLSFVSLTGAHPLPALCILPSVSVFCLLSPPRPVLTPYLPSVFCILSPSSVFCLPRDRRSPLTGPLSSVFCLRLLSSEPVQPFAFCPALRLPWHCPLPSLLCPLNVFVELHASSVAVPQLGHA